MIYFLLAIQVILAGAFFFMRGRSKHYSAIAVMVGDEYMFFRDLSDRAMTVAISYLQLCMVFWILVMVAFIIPDPWELPAISASAMVSLYFLYGFYQRRLVLYKGLSLPYVRKLMEVIRIATFAFGVLTLAMLLASCTYEVTYAVIERKEKIKGQNSYGQDTKNTEFYFITQDKRILKVNRQDYLLYEVGDTITLKDGEL